MNKKQPPKIFIATPMYGYQAFGAYISSFVQLTDKLTKRNIEWSYYFCYHEALIQRARNFLVHKFLESSCDYLLFVDADVSFEAEDVLKMVSEDKDVIGGIYPKKMFNWNRIHQVSKNSDVTDGLHTSGLVYVVHTANKTEDINFGGIEEVDSIGTGYLLIKRSVFDALKPHVPSYLATVDPNDLYYNIKFYEFFGVSIDPDTNILLSEDYDFCRKWRSIGGSVYAATYAVGTHTGAYTFGSP